MTRHEAPTGLIQMSQEGLVQRQLRVLNKTQPDKPRDWFKITNKAESDNTDVYIYDEIGGWFGTNAQDFVNQIQGIKTGSITLHLNSPGGEVFDGVAIYNALRQHDAQVTVVVDSLAASAASFIAQAGDKIVMNLGSTMMIHDGLAFAVGNQKDMLDTANILDKISNNIAGIYANRAGGTMEDWRALMREEVWYTAQEAVDAGLADEVASETAPAEAVAATNNWDLSVFNHAGRDDAPSPESIRKKIITNRAKEAPVSQPKVKASDETPNPSKAEPVQPGTPSPEQEVVPDPTTAEEEGELQQGTQDGPESTPVSNKAGFSVLINGVATSDPRAIQAHVASLEGFRDETRTNNRKAFIDSLVKGGKIVAAQQAKLEAFALGLDDEQYAAWSAVYNDAPSLPMFGQHAEGTTNHSGDGDSAAAAKNDRIEVLKGIVAQHKMSGMQPEKIKATSSYNELAELDPQFKL